VRIVEQDEGVVSRRVRLDPASSSGYAVPRNSTATDLIDLRGDHRRLGAATAPTPSPVHPTRSSYASRRALVRRRVRAGDSATLNRTLRLRFVQYLPPLLGVVVRLIDDDAAVYDEEEPGRRCVPSPERQREHRDLDARGSCPRPSGRATQCGSSHLTRAPPAAPATGMVRTPVTALIERRDWSGVGDFMNRCPPRCVRQRPYPAYRPSPIRPARDGTANRSLAASAGAAAALTRLTWTTRDAHPMNTARNSPARDRHRIAGIEARLRHHLSGVCASRETAAGITCVLSPTFGPCGSR